MFAVKFLIVIAIAIAMFFVVRKGQRWLLNWVSDSEAPYDSNNDRVRELAWWAVIGVAGTFIVLAEVLVKAFILTL